MTIVHSAALPRKEVTPYWVITMTIDFSRLHEQNHRITELSNILSHLLGDRSFCDNTVTCELFFRYVECVSEHLQATDDQPCKQLLEANNQHSRNIAGLFKRGSRSINRMFEAYLEKWYDVETKRLDIRDYKRFEAETRHLFQIVLERIEDETEQLYPSVRLVNGQSSNNA